MYQTPLSAGTNVTYFTYTKIWVRYPYPRIDIIENLYLIVELHVGWALPAISGFWWAKPTLH